MAQDFYHRSSWLTVKIAATASELEGEKPEALADFAPNGSKA